MNIKIFTWNHREIAFENVSFQVTKTGYLVVRSDGVEFYKNEIPCSKIEITYPDSGIYDIIIQEW